MNDRKIPSQWDILCNISQAAIREVAAPECVFRVLQRVGDSLQLVNIEGVGSWDLSDYRRVVVLGCGKAAVAMCSAAIEVVGEKRVDRAIAVTKYGHGTLAHKLPGASIIEIYEAGHPDPDTAGYEATQRVYNLLGDMGKEDLVLCMMSGGGSALWTYPSQGITLEDIRATTSLLLKCGASIDEINTIRKHVSSIKGGLAAAAAYPAQCVVVGISDVVSNDPSVIASGPFSPDDTTWEDARSVLERYNLGTKMPRTITQRIDNGIQGRIADTPKQGSREFDTIHYCLCATLHGALDAAARAAQECGFNVMRMPKIVQDDVNKAADSIFSYFMHAQNDASSKQCVLSGGEPTVTLADNYGKGGRNQQLALLMALKFHENKCNRLSFMSLGTDGTDGPTDAAGAIVDCNTVTNCIKAGYDPYNYARRHDAYSLFSQTGHLVKTGPTHTNVMDIHLLLQQL